MKHFNNLKRTSRNVFHSYSKNLVKRNKLLERYFGMVMNLKIPMQLINLRTENFLRGSWGTFLFAIDLMMQSGDIEKLHIRNHAAGKRQRIGKYLHHNKVTPD